MILKVYRPVFPQDAAYHIFDQSGTVFLQTKVVPGRVANSCLFKAAYWTARIVNKQVEFMRQVEDQKW